MKLKDLLRLHKTNRGGNPAFKGVKWQKKKNILVTVITAAEGPGKATKPEEVHYQ